MVFTVLKRGSGGQVFKCFIWYNSPREMENYHIYILQERWKGFGLGLGVLVIIPYFIILTLSLYC